MKKYHYTYRITNLITGMHYYGDRSSDCHPQEDLGIKYFSSFTEKWFKLDQIENPSHYKYKIIKIFNTRKEAKALEIKLHRKFNVKNNPKFYNKANQETNGFCYDRTGIKDSLETKLKKSMAFSGVPKSNEHRKKLSSSIKHKFEIDTTYKEKLSIISKEWHKNHDNPFKGKSHSEETRQLMSVNHADFNGENHPLYGKTHSEESKKKMSIAKKNKGFKPSTSKNLLLISPDGTEYKIYGKLTAFCVEHNLGEETIRKIYTKGIKPTRKNNRNYGWDVKIIE